MFLSGGDEIEASAVANAGKRSRIVSSRMIFVSVAVPPMAKAFTTET